MNKAHLRRLIFKILKKNKFIFCQFEWYNWKSEVIKQRQENINCHLKSDQEIKIEKKLVKDYWRCGTFHYERYGLAYKELSNEELLNYVPTYYHHVVLEKAHRGIDTVYYGDKLTQAKLFIERDIPNANVLATIKGGRCVNFTDGNPLDISKLFEQYFSAHSGKLFIKPADGQEVMVFLY